MWTNISNWAINHCSSRGFNLVEAWVRGRLTVIDMLLFDCGALFRGAGR